ncbi:FecR domain-containing protein [Rhodopseudomonas palustris]|uniref:FecR family protein n=1 Tax=Rhodopseudomonas palustris TaxID=1076 RepID=UPI002ACD65C5|nr:FecR domain-containing protein [Rhodopseudomonas palustris]WQH00501.1 FecR domain-containing protein [Rhodopseudomonas palustris]
MTTNSDVPDPTEDPMIAARRWVIRLRSGEAGRSDVEALGRWRAENVAHRRAFALANAQWDVLRQAAKNVVKADIVNPQKPANTLMTRRVWMGGALAASVGGAAYLAVRPPLELWPSLSELNADYRTEIGERRQIDFADNVSVEMNTRTSLTALDLGENVQGLNLVSGEIAVTTGKVGTAPGQPFVIVAGSGRVSATQAMFDLRRDGQDVAVTCLEGGLIVACGQQTAELKAGQHISFGAQGLGVLAATDGRVVGAWRQGLLVFENQPLAQVIPEINRYRRGRIVLTSDRVARLPLDATFRLDRIDEVVPKLAHLFGLKVRALPGGVVFLS